MAQTVEQIIEGLAHGSMSLDAACEMLASEVRSNAEGVHFWPRRIEEELRRNRLSRAAVRRLLDAVESFEGDKTLWLDSSSAVPRTGTAAGAAPSARMTAKPQQTPLSGATDTSNILRIAPTSKRTPLTTPFEWFSKPSMTLPMAGIERPEFLAVSSGSVIGDRYRVMAHLGQGGVGQVFNAIDLKNSRERDVHITLKMVAVNLRHEPHAFASLEAAVRRTQHLAHRNIVAVHDVIRDEDRAFIVMEPLRGRWLSGLVREVRNKGLPYELAWPTISGIARGLAFAHRRGIVHSDLSPHAVFVCEDGTPKVMGFGLIRAVPNSNESLDVLDTLTLRAYTEAYIADAWAQQGVPHPADDLYPLGVLAYEMLTGTHPFQRCSLSVAKQKGLTFERIPGLNRHARQLIERCLSFEREVRPQNADRFVQRMQPGMIRRLLVAAGVHA